MEDLRGACIVGQSGGPTSVINASALGVIQAALVSDAITRVLGTENGITGILRDRLIDLGQEDPVELERLRYAPSSTLGSCRHKLADPDADETDIEEAYGAGKAAVEAALAWHSGVMIGFARPESPDYRCITAPVPLSEVANREKKCRLTGSTNGATG